MTQTEITGGLKATQESTLELSWTAVSGEHNLTVKVDDADCWSCCRNCVSESNERNNKLSQFIPPKTGSIVGTVTDATTGATLDGVLLTSSIWQKKASTNIDGSYAIDSIPIGNYELTASKPGYDSSIKVVNIENEKTMTMDFALSRVSSVPHDGEWTFSMDLSSGLHMLSLPLKPNFPFTARSFAEKLGATLVLEYDETEGTFSAFLPELFDDGFLIKGGFGYIVNLKSAINVTFTGQPWANAAPAKRESPLPGQKLWAFAVGGRIVPHGNFHGEDFRVTVTNLRTNSVAQGIVGNAGDDYYYTVVFADVSRQAVVEPNDTFEINIFDSDNRVLGSVVRTVVPSELLNASMMVHLPLHKPKPNKTALLQNYPNPFNPETWIPYQLGSQADVSIEIYSIDGKLVRILNLGKREAGFYTDKNNAAYWDGVNNIGEKVASGVYFYVLNAGEFRAVRKFSMVK